MEPIVPIADVVEQNVPALLERAHDRTAYGAGWQPDHDVADDGPRGVGRLATRATLGRPHRFHDLLLAVELAAPAVVEALAWRERTTR